MWTRVIQLGIVRIRSIHALTTHQGEAITSTQLRPFVRTITELGDNDDTGPLTDSYLVDAEKVIDMLNQALASEVLSWLNYTAHATAASGLRADAVSREFHDHAQQELEHAQQLIRRIDQLGGEPGLNPTVLAERSIHPFEGPAGLTEMMQVQLEAERRAVEFYRSAVQWVGDRDPTTRRLLEDILAVEEHHANDLDGLLQVSE